MKKDSTPEGRSITGADVWELLFEITSGDVPDGMTDNVCEQLADRLNGFPHATPAPRP